jgi:RNA polymerase sigma factor (sigma-70 family)
LFEDHAGRVARYAARRVEADDVQDVVSEVFLAAWRRLDDLPEDALPWLFAAARNVVANRRRSRARRRALDDKLAHAGSSPEDGPAVLEVDARLLAAIRRLPESEREAFMLVAWDGLDHARAARAAGCTPAAFRVRLHRARRRLRNEVDRDAPLATLAGMNSSVKEMS